jgi:hypothetical protein
MDIFKSFATAADRQIEHNRENSYLNFLLTQRRLLNQSEYEMLSPEQRMTYDATVKKLHAYWEDCENDENAAQQAEDDRKDLAENGFWS